MDNITFFIIILIAIAIIYCSHTNSSFFTTEPFVIMDSTTNANTNVNTNVNTDSNTNTDLLTLNSFTRCNVLSQKKYMIRDINTRLWLMSGQEEGFSKFLPGNFGSSLLISENPDEYLPLRMVANPNDYLLSTYNGKGIRVITNPNNKFYILQIFIYEGLNIIGYIDESETHKYFQIDSNGHITSTINPTNASRIELIYL